MTPDTFRHDSCAESVRDRSEGPVCAECNGEVVRALEDVWQSLAELYELNRQAIAGCSEDGEEQDE